MRKTFAIICATIIILSIMAIPVCAIENNAPYYWGNISDTATSLLVIENPITDDANLTQYNDYFSTAGARKFVEIVENAYTIGLFGGNVPVAIVSSLYYTNENQSNYLLQATVYCVTQRSIAIRYGEGYDKLTAEIGFSTITDGLNNTIGNDYMYAYQIAYNGDISPYEPNHLSDIDDDNYNSTRQFLVDGDSIEGYKVVAVFNGYSWETSQPNNPCFASYWANNAGTTSARYDHVLSEYDKTGVPNVTYNYELDIPGIITAIPNGAKQIINNAFGFEIFGINIAGLLSVLLIVTIVAFVVKWLMNR